MMADEGSKREFTVIVSADVVGSPAKRKTTNLALKDATAQEWPPLKIKHKGGNK